MPRTLEGDLAALSEGACPEHGTPLRVTGWCPACQAWWSADFPERTVITDYPGPVTRPPEP
jgi:hypothetical protein